ncbi:MAG: hypothetical protein R2824_09860 [Saprospiraceae bacterium]
MYQSSLLKLIKSLDNKQIQELEKFLRSPYHNTNKTLLAFFRYIRPYHPALESKKLDKKRAFHHLFPHEEYEDQKMRKQMTFLKSAIEEFLCIDLLKKDQLLQVELMNHYYYNIETYEEYARRIKKSKTLLSKNIKNGEIYYHQLYALFERLFYHPGRSEYPSEKHLISNFARHLDIYYILSKLRLATDYNIRNNVVDEATPFIIPIETLWSFVDKMEDQNALITLYKLLYNFQFSVASVTALSEVIDLYQVNFQTIDKKEKSFILQLMINICIHYFNQGHTPFLSLIYRLFKLADEEELILYQNKMQSSVFLNAVVMCSAYQKFAWVERFMKKYKYFLDEEERESVVQFARAYLLYQKSLQEDSPKELMHEAFDLLAKIKYSGIIIDLRLRSLQLRILYEIDFPEVDIDLLNYYAKAFVEYLRRNRLISKNRKLAYKNFVKYLKNIVKLIGKTKPVPQDILQLKNKIIAEEQLILQQWLLKKLEELDEFLQNRD